MSEAGAAAWLELANEAFATLEKHGFLQRMALCPQAYYQGGGAAPADIVTRFDLSGQSDFTLAFHNLCSQSVGHVKNKSRNNHPLQIANKKEKNLWFSHGDASKIYVPDHLMNAFYVAYALGVYQSTRGHSWERPLFSMPPLVLRLWGYGNEDDDGERVINRVFVDFDHAVDACTEWVQSRLDEGAQRSPCKFLSDSVALADEHYVENFDDDELAEIAAVAGDTFVEFFRHRSGHRLTRADVVVVATAPDAAQIKEKGALKIVEGDDGTVRFAFSRRTHPTVRLKLSCWLVILPRAVLDNPPAWKEHVRMYQHERTSLKNESVRLFDYLAGSSGTGLFTCSKEALKQFNLVLGSRFEELRLRAFENSGEVPLRGGDGFGDLPAKSRLFCGTSGCAMSVDDKVSNMRLLHSAKQDACPLCAHALLGRPGALDEAFDERGDATFACASRHECTCAKEGDRKPGDRSFKNRRHRPRVVVGVCEANHKDPAFVVLRAWTRALADTKCRAGIFLGVALTSLYVRESLARRVKVDGEEVWSSPETLVPSMRGEKEYASRRRRLAEDGKLMSRETKRIRLDDGTLADVPKGEPGKGRPMKEYALNDVLMGLFRAWMQKKCAVSQVGQFVDPSTRGLHRLFCNEPIAPEALLKSRLSSGQKIRVLEALWAHANTTNAQGFGLEPPTPQMFKRLLGEPLGLVEGVDMLGIDVTGPTLASFAAYETAHGAVVADVLAGVLHDRAPAEPILKVFVMHNERQQRWLRLEIRASQGGDDLALNYCPALTEKRLVGEGEKGEPIQAWKWSGDPNNPQSVMRLVRAGGGEIPSHIWNTHGPYHDSCGNRPYWEVIRVIASRGKGRAEEAAAADLKHGAPRYEIKRWCWQCKVEGKKYCSPPEILPADLCLVVHKVLSEPLRTRPSDCV
tara:strand:+ start:2109 stop:4847 length:2739 start_codon:yes stop_codon:yes gene_type:complete